MLVEVYEKSSFPIEAPDPVDFLGYVMETRDLTRKDLEPYIGPRGRVGADAFQKREAKQLACLDNVLV